MGFSDNFYKKVEKKTNINKDTILSLANKLQDGNMKNETTLREVISELSQMTGKEVSKEKEDKIMGVQNGSPSIRDNFGRIQYPTWINESGQICNHIGQKGSETQQLLHL